MTVRVDISEVLAAEARFLDERKRTPQIMRAIVATAAANERAQHEYQNRTKLGLQASTQASIARRSNDGATVELVMDREYASYVVRRGLSEIDEQAKGAERAIAAALEAQAKRVAG